MASRPSQQRQPAVSSATESLIPPRGSAGGALPVPRPAADFPPVDVEPLGNRELPKHRPWGGQALPTLSETRLGPPVACCCVWWCVRVGGGRTHPVRLSVSVCGSVWWGSACESGSGPGFFGTDSSRLNPRCLAPTPAVFPTSISSTRDIRFDGDTGGGAQPTGRLTTNAEEFALRILHSDRCDHLVLIESYFFLAFPIQKLARFS